MINKINKKMTIRPPIKQKFFSKRQITHFHFQKTQNQNQRKRLQFGNLKRPKTEVKSRTNVSSHIIFYEKNGLSQHLQKVPLFLCLDIVPSSYFFVWKRREEKRRGFFLGFEKREKKCEREKKERERDWVGTFSLYFERRVRKKIGFFLNEVDEVSYFKTSFLIYLIDEIIEWCYFFLLFSLSFHNKQTNNNSVSVSSNYCQNFNFLFLLIELLVLSFVPTTIKRRRKKEYENTFISTLQLLFNLII